MNGVITIGVDLAKNVFQVHGVDAEGAVVVRRLLRRGQMLPFFKKQPPCLVGMEACATSHHWAREIEALGHQVRLMPPRYVKPYVKRNKNDMAGAEAICEAVTRPTMRFVEVKEPEQQALLGLHRVRDLVVRQRTQVINMIRGLLREFGHILPKGPGAAIRFAKSCLAGDLPDIPDLAKGLISTLCDQLTALCGRISMYSKLVERHSRLDKRAWRLRSIPGVGPMTASAIVGPVAEKFRSPISFRLPFAQISAGFSR